MSSREWPLGVVIPLQDFTPFSPFAPTEWKEALHCIAAAGYAGVEFAITDPNTIDRNELMRVLQKERLRFFAIATGQAAEKEGLSLSSREDKIRERAIKRIIDHMRLAKEFAAIVIVGALRGKDGDKELLVESLRACASFDSQVKIALEAINRYETRLVNTISEALEIITLVGADNLGVHLDTFHANIEEQNIGESIRATRGKLFHVDLADSNRWIPGYGHLNFKEVWDALDSIGYEGHLIIEAFPRPSPEALLAAANKLRTQWDLTRE